MSIQFKELRGNIPVAISVPALATAAAGGGLYVAPYNLQLVSAQLVWAAAVNGVATNNFTISFFNRQAGAGTVQWATAITYAAGTNASKATPITLTLSGTATDLQWASGDVISVEVTQNGTGLAVPNGTIQLAVRGR